MKTYNKYPKYKHSGIPWIGEIPEHWEENYIKGITRTYSEKNKPNFELLSVYRDYGVIIKSSRDDNYNKPGMDLSSYKVVYPNVLVLNKMKTWQGSLGISSYLGIVSPAYITCKINLDKINSNFLNYLLRSKNYVFEYNRLSYGVRPSQWDMRYQDFKSIPIYLPPLPEQTAIAEFLDRKTEMIDRFVSKKKRLIELLNEKKQALINQAITKGINPNAKMKHSGIDWLGEIPEHWEVRKLKYIITKPISGLWGQEANGNKNDIYCIRVADFLTFYVKNHNLTKRNILLKDEQLLKKGDLLIEKSGGGEKTPVGRIVMFNHNFKAVTSNFVSKFSVKKEVVDNFYILYLFKALHNIKWNTKSIKQTTGIQNLDLYDYLNNWVYFPPLSEQKQIVSYIEKELTKIDSAIAIIEKEIKLVEEYKTALISEAVTGKIDIRDKKYTVKESDLSVAAEKAIMYKNK